MPEYYERLSGLQPSSAAGPATLPMQRADIAGNSVNYVDIIEAPGEGFQLYIYSVSLLLGLAVPVTFLYDSSEPEWASFDSAGVIEPPFKEPYALPEDKPFIIRFDNGEDSVPTSGTVEYKVVPV